MCATEAYLGIFHLGFAGASEFIEILDILSSTVDLLNVLFLGQQLL